VARKQGVPKAVVDVVKAWAAERDLDLAPAVLAAGRRALDPMLVPALVVEVAEVQGELLLEVLDLPPRAPPARDAPLTEFHGMQLRADQLERFKAWIDDQAPTAEALGMDVEKWAPRLEAGLATAIDVLRGTPSHSAAAVDAAQRLLSSKKLVGDASGPFTGGADPRTSEKAGLRGILAARSFDKKR
jgi:hypothetical protein